MSAASGQTLLGKGTLCPEVDQPGARWRTSRLRNPDLLRPNLLLRSAFYEVARNEADVVNFFAQSVVSGSAIAAAASAPKQAEAPKQVVPQGQQ